MYTLFVILIVIASLLMIGIVLIQESKGGGLSSNFSSTNSIMGVRKTTDIVEKGTWVLVTFIVLISIASAYIVPTATTDESVIEHAASQGQATNPNNLPNFGASQQKQAAPANKATAPASAAPTAPAAPAE